MKLVSPSQLDQSNPGTWPIYYKAIIWLVLFFGILFAFNHFKVSEMNDIEASNNKTIDERKATYKQLYQYTLDLEAYRSRNQELLARLEGLLAYLPAQSQIAELIDSVYMTGSDAGISLSGFKPADKYLPTEYYDIAPINLDTITYFTNFANFSEGLTNLQQIMNISDFKLSVLKGENSRNNNVAEFWADNAIAVSETQLQTYIYNGDVEKLRKGELPTQPVPTK